MLGVGIDFAEEFHLVALGRPGEGVIEIRRVEHSPEDLRRRSGKSELVVSNRLAYNRYLRDAVQQWAFCSLNQSGWAREFYDAQRARGKRHHAALRALGNRWLEVLWHYVRNRVAYDEETHVANRKRYLQMAA